MSNTAKHVTAGVSWLLLVPVAALALFALGALPNASVTAISLLWAIGLLVTFGSWALADAPAHGKPRAIAVFFTAAWLVLFVLAVFPYLFVTRGAKGGLIASLKFLCLCLGLAIVWVGVLPLLGRLV